MDADFWKQKWERNDIAFHGSEANALLVKSFDKLALPECSRIFVPLCGKTLDIHWLLSTGYRVAGAELSKLAIEQLFAELGLEPNVSNAGDIEHYSATDIDIFVGDLFSLTRKMLGPIDAIYDRAAMVALPATTRERYAAHLIDITDAAPQLLVAYEYDQSLVDGPPFSVTGEEIHHHYSQTYQLTHVASVETPGGLKGKYPAIENVWLLQK